MAVVVQSGAGQGQHFATLVNPNRCLNVRSQQGQHAAGAGAHIQNGVQRRRGGRMGGIQPQQAQQGAFYLGLVNVQGTNGIPLPGIIAEKG
jgi:hypothetical protein